MSLINFEWLHKKRRGDIMWKSSLMRKSFLLRQFQWAKFTTPKMLIDPDEVNLERLKIATITSWWAFVIFSRSLIIP